MTQSVHQGEHLLGGTKDLKANPIFNDQPFKLGVFNSNASGGLVQSNIPTGFRITWDQQLAISRVADEMGMEAVVPAAKLVGYRGETNFNGISYETLTWAAGISQATRDIAVFATTQLPAIHPVLAAKMAATIDHISGGRFGINLTMGWFPPEMEIFREHQLEHDERYRYGQEWLDIAEALWDPATPVEEDLEWTGKYFSFKNVHSLPHPIQSPRPPLINAGSSPAGQDFSARNVDVNLIALPVEEMKEYVTTIKRKANDEYERDIDVWSYCLVICRETEAEAKAVQRQILELGDVSGARNLMTHLGMQTQSFTSALRTMQERFIAGGGATNIVGTPEQVAEQFAEFKEAGVGGAIVGFVDYLPELQQFRDEVMPALARAGLRH